MPERAKSGIGRVQAQLDQVSGESEATYAALRSVIAGGAGDVPRGVKAALVGLLPEVQDHEPDVKQRMRDKGLGHLVEAHETRVRENHARLMGDA